MRKESFLVSYRALKRDMEAFPIGSPLRKKIKQQKSDLIQEMHNEVRKGNMSLPEGFNTIDRLPDDLKYLAKDYENWEAPEVCEKCGQIIKEKLSTP